MPSILSKHLQDSASCSEVGGVYFLIYQHLML